MFVSSFYYDKNRKTRVITHQRVLQEKLNMNSTPIIENKPGGLKCMRQICRLCMSTESLEDVFGETNLQKLISDFLSIQVSNEDRLGHAICAICRLRIIEFHQFWSRCHEVQEVLQSMVRDLNVDEAKELSTHYNQKQLTFNEPIEVKTEPCEEPDFALVTDQAECGFEPRTETQSTVMNLNHDQIVLQLLSGYKKRPQDVMDGEGENEQPIRMNDEIDIEPVKIEQLENDDEESQERSTVAKKALTTKSAKTTQIVQIGEKAGIDKTLQCSSCKKIYKSKKQLAAHKRQICAPKKHYCDVCGVGFPYPNQLERHKLSKLHVDNMECNSSDAQPVEDDERDEEDQKWQCVICSTSFPDKQQLIYHTLTHGSNNIRPKTYNAVGPFICDICQKEFKWQSILTWHKMRVHVPKLHVCQKCGSKFSTRDDLLQHKQANYRNKGKN